MRTTLDPKLQEYARKALMDGLIGYDHGEGFRGPVATRRHLRRLGRGRERGQAAERRARMDAGRGARRWTPTRRRSASGRAPTSRARCSTDRVTGTLAGPDIKWVSKKLGDDPEGRRRDLRLAGQGQGRAPTRSSRCPRLEGALVAMDPRTGRVLAMVGGFSYAESEFNRATQALRQPGSSFKPIVYSAALDNGYTPASVVLDAPIEVVNADGSVWRPENYAQAFYGPQTLRRGIEKQPKRHDRAAGPGSRHAADLRLRQDVRHL